MKDEHQMIQNIEIQYAICQTHDITYSLAGDNLAKKHEAVKIMEDCIKAIPFGQRPWFATPTMYAIKTKRTLGLGVK